MAAKVSPSSYKHDQQRPLRGSEIRIPVPWGHIAGKTWGSPNGYPILGIHGWLDNAGTFDKLAQLLPPSIRFIAVDLPGHGFSSRLPVGVPQHILDLTVVIKRVADHLELNKFSLIGHSFGGGLSCIFAALFPEQVENLVMIDMIFPVTGDTNATSKENINQYLKLERSESTPPAYTYSEALHMMRNVYDSVTEEEAKILLLRGIRQVDEDEYCFTVDHRYKSPCMSRMTHEDTFELLRHLKCRTLIIKAKNGATFHSNEIMDQAIAIYESTCESFKLVEMDGNHFIHLNNPVLVSEYINEFLLN